MFEIYTAKNAHDKSGMELISQAQREKVRQNFEAMVKPHTQDMTKLSDASVRDIMLHLARYGGRVEVEGFGSFFVWDVAAKERITPKGVPIVRPARRVVQFAMSKLLRDMINEDYFSQMEPKPNPDYFVEKRNILL